MSTIRDDHPMPAIRLAEADILLDYPVERSKRRVIDRLAAEAADRLGTPTENVFNALNAREVLGGTGLGSGVALPHARMAGDHRPLLLFARLAQPVDWEARDGVPVDLVLLVIWPETMADSLLPNLAELCRRLRDPRTLRRMRSAVTPDEVSAAIMATPADSGGPL